MIASAAATGAAAPPFEDSMAERTRACTACHGKQGRAAPDGFYPRIAGKPAGYLYHQLLNFREGRRHYGLMQHMVDPLSDAYLLEIASYFAALDLPYPPPAATPPRTSQALLERGETLARHGDKAIDIPACVQCHGDALTGVQPAVPGLLGLPLDYLNAQLGAWRAGERRAHAPDCMATIAKRLKPEDITAVASWLSSRALSADTHPAAAPAQPMPLECGSVSVQKTALP
ncbi:MAG: c-type cytochrome [Burkholderiales bacterium]